MASIEIDGNTLNTLCNAADGENGAVLLNDIDNNSATGVGALAQNWGTIAHGNGQTASGKYNIDDITHHYAYIVGNGRTENERSNAFALTWEGDPEIALDTTAASGVDYDIYTALTTLGWESIVIV